LTALNGRFFASGSSDSCPATLSFAEEGGISVELEDRIQVYSESYFEVEPELGKTPRIIRFQDGSLFETTDIDAFKSFESQLKHKPLMAWVSLLERNWRTATASVVAVGVFCVLFFMYGIPAIAMHVAGVVPQSLRVKMSEDTMRLMSKTKMLEASEIDSERRDALEKIFFNAIEDGEFSRDTDFEYKLSFRNAPFIGKNAFALPSGEIVFTDDLVEACSDEQILSIMLHEIAHVELQHGIRSLIQNSGIIIIITLAIGDANGISNLVSSLPTLLAESHYSQKFEIEADSFSCLHLQANGYSPDLLGDSLKILHEGSIEMPLEDFLSTHPSLKARLANIEKSKLSGSELMN